MCVYRFVQFKYSYLNLYKHRAFFLYKKENIELQNHHNSTEKGRGGGGTLNIIFF